MRDVNIKSLNEGQKRNCEGMMSVQECAKVLKNMKNDTSPGIDGLTPAFYKMFWCKVGALVVDSINNGFQTGQLSSSQRKGVIVLLLKGDELPRNIIKSTDPYR